MKSLEPLRNRLIALGLAFAVGGLFVAAFGISLYPEGAGVYPPRYSPDRRDAIGSLLVLAAGAGILVAGVSVVYGTARRFRRDAAGKLRDMHMEIRNDL